MIHFYSVDEFSSIVKTYGRMAREGTKLTAELDSLKYYQLIRKYRVYVEVTNWRGSAEQFKVIVMVSRSLLNSRCPS